MKYVCDACGWTYDEALGDADLGIAPGTKFEELPDDFECPLCGVGKDMFSAEQDEHEKSSHYCVATTVKAQLLTNRVSAFAFRTSRLVLRIFSHS